MSVDATESDGEIEDCEPVKRGIGRPKGSKTKRITVTEGNLNASIRTTLMKLANHFVNLTPREIAKVGKPALMWLEVIDSAFQAGVFPRKGNTATFHKTTLNYKPQTLTVPARLVDLQVSNPQNDVLDVEPEGGGGYTPEGGISDSTTSEGHPSEKFPEVSEIDDDESPETNT